MAINQTGRMTPMPAQEGFAAPLDAPMVLLGVPTSVRVDMQVGPLRLVAYATLAPLARPGARGSVDVWVNVPTSSGHAADRLGYPAWRGEVPADMWGAFDPIRETRGEDRYTDLALAHNFGIVG